MAHQGAIRNVGLSRRRNTDNNIRLSGKLSEKQLESRQQGDEWRTAMLRAGFLNLLAEVTTEFADKRCTVIRFDQWARPVRWQFQSGSGFSKLGNPILLHRRVRLPSGRLSVFVKRKRRRQPDWFTGTKGIVAGRNFVQQNANGPAVTDDVVGGDQQHVALCRQFHEMRAHQRSGDQIKHFPGFPFFQFRDPLCLLNRSPAGQIVRSQWYGERRMY